MATNKVDLKGAKLHHIHSEDSVSVMSLHFYNPKNNDERTVIVVGREAAEQVVEGMSVLLKGKRK